MNKLHTIPDLDKEEIEIFSVAMDGQDKMKEWVDSLVSDQTTVENKKKKKLTEPYSLKEAKEFHPNSSYFTKNLSLPPQVTMENIHRHPGARPKIPNFNQPPLSLPPPSFPPPPSFFPPSTYQPQSFRRRSHCQYCSSLQPDAPAFIPTSGDNFTQIKSKVSDKNRNMKKTRLVVDIEQRCRNILVGLRPPSNKRFSGTQSKIDFNSHF